jgi:outer membrane protein
MSTARIILTSVLVMCGFLLQAQLKLEDAIQKTLKQNFGIQVLDNAVQIADEQNSMGNAGLMPTVDLQAGGSYSNSNAELTILGLPEDLVVTGAEATNLNSSINLNYVLFNGFAAQSNYKKLGIAVDLANTQRQMAVEGTVLQVINNYFLLANLQRNREVLKQSIEISKDRLDRARIRYDYGGNNKVDVLSAEVDYSRDSINYLNNEVALSAAFREIYFLMGEKEVPEGMTVETSVEFREKLDYEALWKQAQNQNAAFHNAQQAIALAEQDQNLARSGAFPTVALNSSYSFTRSENEASQAQKILNNGFTAGLSLNYRLYGGGQRRTASKVAALNLKNSLIQKEEQERLLEKDMQNAYADYLNKWELVDLEEQNLKTAELNFQRSKELFNLGKLTNTQFREAQLNLNRSRILVYQSEYNLKIAEANLIQLSGGLLAN